MLGKTVMANMIAAFFEHAGEPSLFDQLSISRYDLYQKHVGQHDVIYIDFSEMPRACQNYQDYINRIQDGLIRDIKQVCPECLAEESTAVWDILSQVFEKTGHDLRMQKWICYINDIWKERKIRRFHGKVSGNGTMDITQQRESGYIIGYVYRLANV